MLRGEPYRINWEAKRLEEITEARDRYGWCEFHSAAGQIAVFFDDYRRKGKRVTVAVFTSVPNRHMDRVTDLKYLCHGEGHDAISASIDGLRKSGGSSLQVWLTALSMQVEQLRAMADE